MRLLLQLARGGQYGAEQWRDIKDARAFELPSCARPLSNTQWMALEAGFQKIKHAEDLPKPARALELSAAVLVATAVSPSAPSTNAINRTLEQACEFDYLTPLSYQPF